MIKSEIERIEHQGELRQIFTDIYRHCESKRTERILWIDLNCTNQPYEASINNISLTEFAEAIINFAEQLNEETLF